MYLRRGNYSKRQPRHSIHFPSVPEKHPLNIHGRIYRSRPHNKMFGSMYITKIISLPYAIGKGYIIEWLREKGVEVDLNQVRKLDYDIYSVRLTPEQNKKFGM